MATLHEEKSNIKTRVYIGKTKNKATLVFHFEAFFILHKTHKRYGVQLSMGAKIRNRYNQVPHLAQDTNGKMTNS